jgi:hypothetical protein
MLALGIILLFSPFLATRINPDVSLSLEGVLLAFLGVLVLAANAFGKRVRLQGWGLLLAIGGWVIFGAGTLISLAGFLLESGVACMCPASGPCECFVTLYEVMWHAGFVAALAGLVGIAGGWVISRREQLKPEAPTLPRFGSKNIGKGTAAVLAIALAAVIVFGLFSYWPGVYVTGASQSTQFIGGMPSLAGGGNPLPFTTSMPGEADTTFELGLGGSFTYVVHFTSLSSYPDYRVESLSVSFGFSSSSNASLPLVISPADPSVTVILHVRGPYYPYYGDVYFSMQIENLNGTAS